MKLDTSLLKLIKEDNKMKAEDMINNLNDIFNKSIINILSKK